VSAHVAACGACRAEAESFTAALSLLPLASPSFGESERADLRRRVLGEIAEPCVRHPLLGAFPAPRRFVLAALVGAMVIVASLLSPFLVREAGEPIAVTPLAPPASAGPAPSTGSAVAAPPFLPARAASRVARPGRRPRPPLAAAGRSGPAMRLEIQTGNVNVRIIWFVGPAAEEPPPGPPMHPNGIS
jgi:hypothetical protein